MMEKMIRLVAERGIADRFHFPGFMKGKQVYECLKDSDVYVMPSVSEPFGISPLEAMQCGTPSIISKQSGCAEILNNCIKVDYWDIHALADAIYSDLPHLSLPLQVLTGREVSRRSTGSLGRKWEYASSNLYHQHTIGRSRSDVNRVKHKTHKFNIM